MLMSEFTSPHPKEAASPLLSAVPACIPAVDAGGVVRRVEKGADAPASARFGANHGASKEEHSVIERGHVSLRRLLIRSSTDATGFIDRCHWQRTSRFTGTKGSTTTPFDLALVDCVSQYGAAIRGLEGGAEIKELVQARGDGEEGH
ncbi:xylulose-5-phosphate phosphoketolase [Colletotrichum orchidophilum]|uniref:Xylulose-5-phosphate phosphoketolase n=1 Tax=Colletotrichum orchidophilum TaxID=1209926 RepID=A0A1G4BAC7_9PEZI|nr:xylulose-5-phosphate phosphoketolase [Colletotrichum orchidophilum]OHE98369.1 xylulose-5-phosphate phosphoketolase [Colletotrichum orchidophilum]